MAPEESRSSRAYVGPIIFQKLQSLYWNPGFHPEPIVAPIIIQKLRDYIGTHNDLVTAYIGSQNHPVNAESILAPITVQKLWSSDWPPKQS